jgi:hypothetical protein
MSFPFGGGRGHRPAARVLKSRRQIKPLRRPRKNPLACGYEICSLYVLMLAGQQIVTKNRRNLTMNNPTSASLFVKELLALIAVFVAGYAWTIVG